MMGASLLATYDNGVPLIGSTFGVPSIGIVVAVVRLTQAVCGMLLVITASRACGVPGTETLTIAFGLLTGMFLKSAGKLVPGTKLQGPCVDAAVNHRPEMSTYSLSLSR